jgi:oxygen-dependent protoporphyrinogen oxidase
MSKYIEKDVVIIGGGISGLTTAYYLKKAGLDIAIIEKNEHAGGSIITEKSDDFILDLGPNSMMDTTPLIGELTEELGIAEKREYTKPAANKRYIVRNGQLKPMPTSPPAFIKSDFFSLKTKLGLIREPFIRPLQNDVDESLADFVRRRLGGEFLDYAIDPFVSGIFAGVPERLSVRSAFPKLYALEEEYGSIIKGAVLGARKRKKRKEKSKQTAKMMSFDEGMHVLPDALAQAMEDDIYRETSVAGIAKNDEFRIDAERAGTKSEFRSRALMTAIPAHRLMSMKFFSPIGAALGEIYYPPVTVAFVGYVDNSAHKELDGFGFLIPRRENRKILGAIWSSAIFNNRAPEGGTAFTVFIGGARQPQEASESDEQILSNIKNNFRELLGIDKDPDIFRIKRWPRAIPQYQPGHETIISRIEQFEQANPGLFISGNFRGGISVADCIRSADRCASQIIDFMK